MPHTYFVSYAIDGELGSTIVASNAPVSSVESLKLLALQLLTHLSHELSYPVDPASLRLVAFSPMGCACGGQR